MRTLNILREADSLRLEQQEEVKFGRITDVRFVANFILHVETNCTGLNFLMLNQLKFSVIMEVEEHIILKEIEASGSKFLCNLEVGDEVIVDLGNNIYRKAVIESESFSAPSGATYISVSVFNKILSTNKKYAVPIWDLYPLDSKKIGYTAYIDSLSPRGRNFSGRGSYALICEGEILKKVEYCLGRKDANERLLDEYILKEYDINKVYSNGLIYNK